MLALLAAGVYLNALSNPFVFDDIHQIVSNASIVSLTDVSTIVRHSMTRPVTNLSYALDYARSGLDPFGYHLTSLALHVINVLLLFWVIRRATMDLSAGGTSATFTALSGAALFAVHPMMTEAVGYISGRAEVLCATFFLSSFLFFRSSVSAGNRPILSTFIGVCLFLLGLATKETAATLPGVILLYDALLGRGNAAWRARFTRVHTPLLLFVLVLVVARVWYYIAVEHPEAASFGWRNLLVELHVLERYLQLMLVPYPLTIVHRVSPFTSLFDTRLVTATVVLAVMLQAAWVARHRAPVVTFGIAWWYLVLAPSAALIVIADTGQPMAEHRVYLASCGLFIAAAGVLQTASGAEALKDRRWRILGLVSLGAVVAVFSAMTIGRNAVWSSPQRLFGDAARKAPRTWSAQQWAADVHRNADDCETAVTFYRKAIQLRSDYASSYVGLAACARELGRAEEARNALRMAIPLAPRETQARMMLADLEEHIFNRPEEALRLCREAMSLAPDLENARSCVRRIEGAVSDGHR
jgi:hypothetical protein